MRVSLQSGMVESGQSRLDGCHRAAVTNGDETSAYDELDRITGVTYPDLLNVTYTYDANGNRITAGTDTFGYDWRDRLVEANVSSVTTNYGYAGDDVQVADALRSVRLTTDAAGAASGAVDYDAWGNVRSGSSGQLGWTGVLIFQLRQNPRTPTAFVLHPANRFAGFGPVSPVPTPPESCAPILTLGAVSSPSRVHTLGSGMVGV